MPTARGRQAVERRLESAGSVQCSRGPGSSGAPHVSWGSCNPSLPGGCLALEPVEPAAQAEGPSTHGTGPGGACTRRDPRLPGGGPPLRGTAEGQACVATLTSRPCAGPERHSPTQEGGSVSSHWQATQSDQAVTLGADGLRRLPRSLQR